MVVKRRRNWLILSVLVLSLSTLGWGYPELSSAYARWKLSRAFTLGMKRQVIERRLLSERTRFWPESPEIDFVSAGFEARYSLVCAQREVGLQLQFEVREGKPSEADALRSVTSVRKEHGCL